MILSEGWLNVQHNGASIIKAANSHMFGLEKKKSEKMNWKSVSFFVFQSTHLTLDFISHADGITLCIFSLQFGIAKGKM